MLVRGSRYRAAFAAIGLTSKQAIARETGLDAKSVYNALGGRQVGEQFIAKSIALLQRDEYQHHLAEAGIEPTLDSLFEVVGCGA